MKITNVKGTAGLTCSCGSWLDHWKNFSGQPVSYCSEIKCLNKQLVGAHVRKAGLLGAVDPSVYIVPLCDTHNQTEGEIEISDATALVSADPSKTCQRWLNSLRY